MFEKILLPVDLTHKEQLPDLFKAASLLVEEGTGKIRLMYVDPILIHKAGYRLNEDNYKEHEVQARQQLEDLVAHMAPEKFNTSFKVREGPVHDQILEEAHDFGADAIILMAKKPGLSSYFMGSNADKVVRHAECSVFVLRKE